MSKEELLMILLGISVLILGVTLGNTLNKNKILKAENLNLKQNLGYYSGDLKPYRDFVEVKCKIPKEVIDKNWIYQIYVIQGNNTCEVLNK